MIRSLPALAVALRCTDRRNLPASTAAHLKRKPLVPFYRIENGDEETEGRSAAHTVGVIADKMRRMIAAYGEWHVFDAPAFFDLFPEQASLLLQVSERVSTVHVTFYADLLLPSFQRTEQTWAEEFFPAYQAAHPLARRSDLRSSYGEHFLDIEQPKLVAYWRRLLTVVRTARQALSDDIGFLAATGGSEERARWSQAWPGQPPPGLDEDFLTALDAIPTLTLTIEFPLPAHRQPGRLRRLRRMWQRGGWRRDR